MLQPLVKTNVSLKDLSETKVSNEEQFFEIIKKALNNRSVNTNANLQNKSHSIVIMKIFTTNLIDMTTKCGKLYLVDLASKKPYNI